MSSGPHRRIPVTPTARVIVDNDFAGDPDGLLALAHHLLVDAAIVRAVTCTSLSWGEIHFPVGDPAREAATELIRRLDVASAPVVSADVQIGFAELDDLSDGARVILAESDRDDPLPLYIACGGPLTNVASALQHDPTLADRAEIVWIGGGCHDDGAWEYNLAVDVAAARFVFNESRARITQIPLPVYRQCLVSVAELEWELRRAGDFGAWLYDCFTDPPEFVNIGATWPMGDSPPVLVTTSSTESSRHRVVAAPWIAEDGTYEARAGSRPLTLYDTVDTRLLFADFFARLHLHMESS
nr:nucleoside hydrolase [Microbacterium lemovicicum]